MSKQAKVDLSQILENEVRIITLERVLDRLIKKNNLTIDGLSQSEIDSIRDEAAKQINKKYPGADMEYRKN
jgi:hypothetical protein